MKKLLGILLALALVVGVIAVGAVSAFAAEPEELKEIPVWAAKTLSYSIYAIIIVFYVSSTILSLFIPIVGLFVASFMPMIISLLSLLATLWSLEWILNLFGYTYIYM